MNQLYKYKDILHELGYLKIYLTMYLKNTQKEDNLETIQEYFNNNLDVFLRKGHRLRILS